MNKKVVPPSPIFGNNYIRDYSFDGGKLPFWSRKYPIFRAERINVVRSGKVIFRKFGNEAQTTEGNFGCGDLTIKII